MNDHMENTRQDYYNNLIITAEFLFLFIIGYTVLYFQENYLLFYISIFFCTGFLLYFLIKPAYKVIKERADIYDMKTFKKAPFGIGLLCIHWPPYQRMARKLKNEEAIRECEDALKMMENDFEAGWEQFRKWFPKIDRSEKISLRKCQLIGCATLAAIKHKEIRLKSEFKVTAEGIKSRLLLESTSLADFLMEEEKGKAIHPHSDVSQKSFDKDLELEISWIRKWHKELNVTNSEFVFRELFGVRV